jgi:hypothetical protein
MSMADRNPSEYSESKFVYLGADRETFLLSPLKPETLEPLLTVIDDARKTRDMEGLYAAVGALLHVSIAREPLNSVDFSHAGATRIAAKCITMTERELMQITLQVLNYSGRERMHAIETEVRSTWADMN